MNDQHKSQSQGVWTIVCERNELISISRCQSEEERSLFKPNQHVPSQTLCCGWTNIDSHLKINLSNRIWINRESLKECRDDKSSIVYWVGVSSFHNVESKPNHLRATIIHKPPEALTIKDVDNLRWDDVVRSTFAFEFDCWLLYSWWGVEGWEV